MKTLRLRDYKRKVRAAICGQCGRIYTDLEQAEKCCLCVLCKEPVKPGEGTYHSECWHKEQDAKNAAQLEVAEKLMVWDGWVFLEDQGGNNGYFESLKALVEHLDDCYPDPEDEEAEGLKRPEYVFVCTKVSFPGLHVGPLVETLADEMYEDAESDIEGIQELKQALLTFNEVNKDLISWETDYTRAVRVPPREPDRNEGDNKEGTT